MGADWASKCVFIRSVAEGGGGAECGALLFGKWDLTRSREGQFPADGVSKPS